MGYINNAPTTMTSNSAPSPYTASASTQTTGFEAYKAFDGNLETYWKPTTVSNEYIMIDMGAEKEISDISFNNMAGASFSIKEVEILGSTDGKTFTSIAHTELPALSGDNTAASIQLRCVNKFKVIKLLIVSIYNSETSGAFIGINNVQVNIDEDIPSLVFSKIKSTNVPEKVSGERTHIIITDDEKIYTNDNDGNIVRLCTQSNGVKMSAMDW